MDCYKRGHFVWESKKLKPGPKTKTRGTTSKAFDGALLRARQQAEDYARALPAGEGRPPLVVVVDVGHVIELYAEFTRSGGTYTPFPDPRSHRIRLQQLAEPAVRARLRALWTDPLALDPACGSGNFLYVTLEHLKRLEGEVLDQMQAFGDSSEFIADTETVTLQQLRGIELNERAAALAELVLWIGWLQWHVRTRGIGSVAEPVVHDYGNIECRDAVLACDGMAIATGEDGQPLTCSSRSHQMTQLCMGYFPARCTSIGPSQPAVAWAWATTPAATSPAASKPSPSPTKTPA